MRSFSKYPLDARPCYKRIIYTLTHMILDLEINYFIPSVMQHFIFILITHLIIWYLCAYICVNTLAMCMFSCNIYIICVYILECCMYINANMFYITHISIICICTLNSVFIYDCRNIYIYNREKQIYFAGPNKSFWRYIFPSLFGIYSCTQIVIN